VDLRRFTVQRYNADVVACMCHWLFHSLSCGRRMRLGFIP
jgi:hypothetical protein